MKTTQGSMLQSLTNVEAFLTENAAVLGGVINTGARQKLTAAIADLSARTTQQAGHGLEAQGATKVQESLRTILLHEHMTPIARIARADLPNTPALQPLRLPRGKQTTGKLAAAAKGMGQAAAPYTDIFVANGLPADFITQLDAAADALLLSFGDGAQVRAKRKGTTAGLKEQLTAGRKIVHILDSFVQTALKHDPVLLGTWKSVKRVRRVGTRSAAPASPPAPTASSAAPAAPAAPAVSTAPDVSTTTPTPSAA